MIQIDFHSDSYNWKGKVVSTYPEDFSPSRSLIRKMVSVIHDSASNLNVQPEEILELKYMDRIILMNLKVIEPKKKEELFLVILGPEDTLKINKTYHIMASILTKFYQLDEKERLEQFGRHAALFFPKSQRRKILFIGFPAAGKTCIKKAFFDGVDPEILLGKQAPSPTVGLAHYVYSWLDAEVGIIDSAGQEFDLYVSPMSTYERKIAFEEADVVIYVFDILNWENQHGQVMENLEKVIKAKKIVNSSCKIYAFCHKIDLVMPKSDLPGTESDLPLFMQVRQEIEEKYQIKVIFTSIQPNLVHTLFRSMQIILNEMSNIGTKIQKLSAELLENQSKSAILLFNDLNNVVSQSNTPDFELNEFSRIVKLVKNHRETLAESRELGELDYSVSYTRSGFALIIKAVDLVEYDISTVAFICQNTSREHLVKILSQLEERLQIEEQTAKKK